MKLTFICNCLEVNRDGVGGYTNALAQELLKVGHSCHTIALHDGFVTEPVETDLALRLPAGMPWRERLARAESKIRSFDPKWISVQLVLYGFHPKGCPLSLPRRLEGLTRGRRTQVMMHELWTGEETEAKWVDRMIGMTQKRIAINLLARLTSPVIRTSNPAYRALLAEVGFAAEVLPLFGNIPIASASDPDWFRTELERRIPQEPETKAKEFLTMGIFGSIHPQWKPQPFLDQIIEVAAAAGKRPVLVLIGRTGAAGAELQARIARYINSLCCVDFGEQPPESVSKILQKLDFGIATSPWALIGKSSSVAAMIDHGLPVVVTRDDWMLRGRSTPLPDPNPLLFQPERFFNQLRRGLPPAQPIPRLPEIARDDGGPSKSPVGTIQYPGCRGEPAPRLRRFFQGVSRPHHHPAEAAR